MLVRKTTSLFVAIAVTSILNTSCASQAKTSDVGPPSNEFAPQSATQPARNGFTVTIKDIARAPIPAAGFSDYYVRFVADTPNAPAGDAFNSWLDSPSYGNRLWSAIKKYLVNDTQAEAIGVSVALDGQATGNFKPFTLNPTDAANPVYGDHFLGPTFRAGDNVELTFSSSYASTIDTHLIQTAASALQDLSRIYAPNGLLFKAIGAGNITQKMEAADTAFGKAFDVSTNQTGIAKIWDPLKTDHFDVYVNNAQQPIIVLNFNLSETVLAGSGKAKDLKTSPAEILGALMPDGKSQYATLITGDATVYANFNKTTADGFSAFCGGAAQDLVAKGYNSIDRAVILYAFLVTSQWNTRSDMRSTLDQCDANTGALQYTPLALNSADSIKRKPTIDAENARSAVIKAMSAKGGIWDRVSVLISAPTEDTWSDFADDNVNFVAVGHDYQLTDTLLLKAGVPQSFTIDDARQILLTAKLNYDHDRAVKEGVVSNSCYSVSGTQLSSFRGFCFYPNNGKASKPVTIEFDFDQPFSTDPTDTTPNMNTIKFFPTMN